MKLNDVLELIPESQMVRIVFHEEKLEGPNSSMLLMLDNKVVQLEVDNIEAREDVIHIWISEVSL